MSFVYIDEEVCTCGGKGNIIDVDDGEIELLCISDDGNKIRYHCLLCGEEFEVALRDKSTRDKTRKRRLYGGTINIEKIEINL